jgi:hypothetical protein
MLFYSNKMPVHKVNRVFISIGFVILNPFPPLPISQMYFIFVAKFSVFSLSTFEMSDRQIGKTER